MSRYYDYTPFGNQKNVDNLLVLVPGFAGLFKDPCTNAYLTLSRMYFSSLSRFAQPENIMPVFFHNCLCCNSFAYCFSDPINLIDSDGKWPRYPGQMPNAYLQKIDDGTQREWLVSTLEKIEKSLTDVKIKQTGAAILSLADRKAIRREAVTQFAKDYSLYPMHEPKYDKDFRKHISNMSIATDIGLVSLDWLTTIVATGARQGPIELLPALMKPSSRYTLGKNINNVIRPWGGGPKADPKDPYPKRDLNAVKIVQERLFNPNIMFRQVFQPPDPLQPAFDVPKADKERFEIDPQRLQESRHLTDLTVKQMDIARGIIKRYDISGGAGRVAGPGGFASPESNAAIEEYAHVLHPSPSPVGGIYLGGAGGALDGLGMLKGIHTDANGNLILIGEGGVDVKLPPLRLDDVVTVFRSVYLYGEGPTVTIDPNPENPEKSAMIIRHGKATDFTYVGWILYQADRLMKSYCQGVDNKTEKDVVSRVSGYRDILDTIYFGGADPRKAQKEGVWERFWIVPAEARRFDGQRHELTLFDVPLKVKTQKMKWEKDKLVDDTKGKSSPGATAFTSWFTANYDGIAAEQYLTPPPESGITKPVPVFMELRRIAILTAVAEKLRDQGVAMPFWMRDYEVRKVSFERFTPGMEVTRKRQQGNAIQTARIFGGVQLSPDTKSVKTYSTEAEAAKAPAEMRTQAVYNVKLADHLERAVANTISPVVQEPLTLHQVREENRTYQAVSVPGAETLALGPCLLDEVDLAVPVEGGEEIRLVRSFNSFFNPKGPWGRGWAFDLPRLEEIRVPTSRDGSQTTFSTSFELLTPFNSLYARFRNVRPVAELGGAKMLVPDTEGPFHGLSEMKPDFLEHTTTHVLLLKDGREWHFTKQGDLVAIKEGPQVTVYERGPHGRLTRIVAVLGGQVAGRITLEYTPSGQLTKAIGDFFDNGKSRPVSIAYTYNDTGRLVGVTSEDGIVGYRYDGAKVSAVTWQDKRGSKKAVVLRSFQYDSRGRVLSEKNGDATIVHAISAGAKGVVASSQLKLKDGSGKGTGKGTGTTITHYDRRMRPTEAIAADGASTHWTYPEAGGVEMTVTTQDKKSVKIVESSDGRKRTIHQDGAPPITASFDMGGRLTSLSEGGQVALTQEWRPAGQLFRSTSAAKAATLEYDQYGLPSAVTLHPAKVGKKLSEWQNTKLDRKGRPVEVTDYSGMEIHLGYDKTGSLSSAVQKTSDGNLGYNVKRNDQGRIEAVKSSWGETAYTYDKDGSLKRVVSNCRGQSASVELASGRVQSTTGFDGGRTIFAYQKNGPAEGMPQAITCPNGLKLNYTYLAGGDLSAVKVGTDRLVRLGYDKQGRVTSYAWEPVNP